MSANILTTTGKHLISDHLIFSDDTTQYSAGKTTTTQMLVWYVDPAIGSDSNNGTAVSTPFRTVNRALRLTPNILDHNVVIFLAGGLYDEQVRIDKETRGGHFAHFGHTRHVHTSGRPRLRDNRRT